jgi:hypothetical protein
VKDVRPQGGWGSFELGGFEHPVYVLRVWAKSVDRKSNLVGFVPHEFLLGLASWCEAPDEELFQQSLRLGFWVNNP